MLEVITGAFRGGAVELDLQLNHVKSKLISSDPVVISHIHLPRLPGASCNCASGMAWFHHRVNALLLLLSWRRWTYWRPWTRSWNFPSLTWCSAPLKHPFVIPKLLYLLCTSPCFLTPEVLLQYVWWSVERNVKNVSFTSDDQRSKWQCRWGITVKGAMDLCFWCFYFSICNHKGIHNVISELSKRNLTTPQINHAGNLSPAIFFFSSVSQYSIPRYMHKEREMYVPRQYYICAEPPNYERLHVSLICISWHSSAKCSDSICAYQERDHYLSI